MRTLTRNECNKKKEVTVKDTEKEKLRIDPSYILGFSTICCHFSSFDKML